MPRVIPGRATGAMQAIWSVAALALVLSMAACTATDREFEQTVHAVMDTLRESDYTGAFALLCADTPHRTTSADALGEEFGRHAKPWRYRLLAAEYSPTSNGTANVMVTAADRREQEYGLDLRHRDGRWQVCDIITFRGG
jgi:hypothetical protein